MGEQRLSSKEALKILATSGIILSSAALPNLAIAYNFLSKEWRKYKRGDIGRIVQRFHKQELIKIDDRGSETVIVISDKGKARLLKYNFEKLRLKKVRDGYIRVLIFDIPNLENKKRDFLRNKLIELNFTRIQESVYICPYPCKDEIEFIAHFLGISKHIILFQLGKVEFGPTIEYKSIYGSS